jgi:hypothetical protein
VPGEYTITLRVGGKQLSKPVRVELDPRVKVSEADLQAQLATALELRELSSTLNQVVSQIDDLTRQLTTLSETLRRPPVAIAPPAGNGGENDPEAVARRGGGRPPANNALPEISAALDELRKLRAELVRERPLSYRYPPKLREEVSSLLGAVSNPIAPPTEPQKLRLREVKEETAKVVANLNTILATSVRRVNEKLSGQPHVVAGPVTR